jgi:hypothetical protein
MPPYLIFILVSKSTHTVNMVLSSLTAQLLQNCALVRPTSTNYFKRSSKDHPILVQFYHRPDYDLLYQCTIPIQLQKAPYSYTQAVSAETKAPYSYIKAVSAGFLY